MSYSIMVPSFDRMRCGATKHAAQEEAHFAQQLQAQDPSLTRDQALRKAASILARKDRWPSGAEA